MRLCEEGDPGAVGDGEFVVSGGDAAPLLENVEGLLDDGAAFVGLAVEVHRPAAAGAFAFAVGNLIRGSGMTALIFRARKSERLALEE